MIKKLIASLFITIALIASPFAITSATAATKTVKLDVPGMTCALCPFTVRKALENVDGVVEAEADFSSKSATVTFDSDKTSIEALTTATKDAGYASYLKQE